MLKTKKERRIRRKKHIRKSVVGTAGRPRVYLFKSNKYIYVGAADDSSHKVHFSVRVGNSHDEAVKAGKEAAKKLKALKVEEVVFDRSGYKYHGKVQAVADTLRESGIKL